MPNLDETSLEGIRPIPDSNGATRQSVKHVCNEDGVYTTAFGAVQCIVAVDGISSFQNGALATELLIHEIRTNPLQLPPDTITEDKLEAWVYQIITRANHAILEHNSGCCFMLCLVHDNTAYFYQAGDCKAIITRDGEVVFESVDDNLSTDSLQKNVALIYQFRTELGLTEPTEFVYEALYLPVREGDGSLGYRSGVVDSAESLAKYLQQYGFQIKPNDLSTFDQLTDILKRLAKHPYAGKNIVMSYLGSPEFYTKSIIRSYTQKLHPNDKIYVMSDGVSNNLSPTEIAVMGNTTTAYQTASSVMKKLDSIKKHLPHQYAEDDATIACLEFFPPLEPSTQKIMAYLCADTPTDSADCTLDDISLIEAKKMVLLLQEEYKRHFTFIKRLKERLNSLIQSNPKFCTIFFTALASICGEANLEEIDINRAMQDGLSIHNETLRVLPSGEMYRVDIYSPEQRRFKAINLQTGDGAEFEYNPDTYLICKVEYGFDQREAKIGDLKFFKDKACKNRINVQSPKSLLFDTRFYLELDEEVHCMRWIAPDRIASEDGLLSIKFSNGLENNQLVDIEAYEKVLCPTSMTITVPTLFAALIKEFVDNMDTINLKDIGVALVNCGEYIAAKRMAISMCTSIKLFSNAPDAKPSEIVIHDFMPETTDAIAKALLDHGLLKCAQEVSAASKAAGLSQEMTDVLHPMEMEAQIEPNRFFNERKELCRQYGAEVVHVPAQDLEQFVDEECRMNMPGKAS